MAPEEKLSRTASAVSALETKPNPARVQTIRRWHIDQATCDDPQVAGLHVVVRASGEIKSVALCIEPEHAAAMVSVLAQALGQVQAFAAQYTERLHAGKVIPLRAA